MDSGEIESRRIHSTRAVMNRLTKIGIFPAKQRRSCRREMPIRFFVPEMKVSKGFEVEKIRVKLTLKTYIDRPRTKRLRQRNNDTG